jgi:hypothetical protein
MKQLKYLLLALPFIFSNFAIAASLKGTADALGGEAVKIGLALGIFSLAVAGTYLALGKQEGGQKVTLAVLGILVVLLAPTVVTTLKGITGGGVA